MLSNNLIHNLIFFIKNLDKTLDQNYLAFLLCVSYVFGEML